MTGSTFAIIMIVIAGVAGLVIFEGLVLIAADRPYFKKSHPDPMTSKVRGGVHLGDPRSMGAPQDELVRDAIEETMETAAGPAHAPQDAEVRSPGSEARGESEGAREPEPASHGRRRS